MELLDYLLSRNELASQLERRFAEGDLRLHEKYFRNMEMKKERLLALETKSRGTTAELAGIQEHEIEVNQELKKIFYRQS
jgi:hypothetical protein